MRVFKFVLSRAGIGNDDDRQTGPMSGEVAGHRVLEGDGCSGFSSKLRAYELIDVRCGLWVRDVVAAGDRGESVDQSESLQVPFDVLVIGIGSNAESK
jgi:hypothetical protein